MPDEQESPLQKSQHAIDEARSAAADVFRDDDLEDVSPDDSTRRPESGKSDDEPTPEHQNDEEDTED